MEGSYKPIVEHNSAVSATQKAYKDVLSSCSPQPGPCHGNSRFMEASDCVSHTEGRGLLGHKQSQKLSPGISHQVDQQDLRQSDCKHLQAWLAAGASRVAAFARHLFSHHHCSSQCNGMEGEGLGFTLQPPSSPSIAGYELDDAFDRIRSCV